MQPVSLGHKVSQVQQDGQVLLVHKVRQVVPELQVPRDSQEQLDGPGNKVLKVSQDSLVLMAEPEAPEQQASQAHRDRLVELVPQVPKDSLAQLDGLVHKVPKVLLGSLVKTEELEALELLVLKVEQVPPEALGLLEIQEALAQLDLWEELVPRVGQVCCIVAFSSAKLLSSTVFRPFTNFVFISMYKKYL